MNLGCFWQQVRVESHDFTGAQKTSTQYMHSSCFHTSRSWGNVAWKMLPQKKGLFTSWIAGFFTVHPKCFAQIETWWFRYGEVFCYGVSIFSHQHAGWKNHIRMSTDWLKSVRTFDFQNCHVSYWFVFHRNKFSNQLSFGNRTDFPAVSETTLKVPLPF